MNLCMCLLLSVFFVSIICMPVANSDLLIANKLPAARMDIVTNVGSATKPSTSLNEESSTHVSINAVATNEYPLSVTKSIETIKDSYFVDEPIHILVNVACLGGEKINEVSVWEHADKNLPIINCKEYIRTSSINDTLSPEKFFVRNYSYNAKDNLIYMNIKDMYSKESVLYEYTVKPTKAGIYNSYTVVRLSSNYPIYQDYILPLEIKADDENPEFQIALDTKKLNVNCGERMKLDYIIKYLGGSSSNPCRYNITLSESSNYKLTRNNFINEQFEKYKNTLIDCYVSYPDEGTYSLPTIIIGGKYYYNFGDKIEVKHWWRDDIGDPGLFTATILLCLATLASLILERVKRKK